MCRSCWEALRPAASVELVGLDSVTAVADYDELVGRLIVAAKNAGRRDVLRQIGGRMADAAWVAGLGDSVDAVTWVPASPGQRRTRGFDQGRVLASIVATRLETPLVRLLRRRGLAQRGGNRSARLVGPDIGTARPSPPRVVLVDDVMTTGSSLRRAAAVVRDAGALSVDAATFAVVRRD